MIEDRQYRQALAILDVSYPDDYNTAVCLMSLGYDKRALEIMTEQADTSDRNYLLAILYSRLKERKTPSKCMSSHVTRMLPRYGEEDSIRKLTN